MRSPKTFIIVISFFSSFHRVHSAWLYLIDFSLLILLFLFSLGGIFFLSLARYFVMFMQNDYFVYGFTFNCEAKSVDSTENKRKMRWSGEKKTQLKSMRSIEVEANDCNNYNITIDECATSGILRFIDNLVVFSFFSRLLLLFFFLSSRPFDWLICIEYKKEVKKRNFNYVGKKCFFGRTTAFLCTSENPKMLWVQPKKNLK